jgi:hypothetical protein
VALFCLALALAGPLLTHAEAADDLARSLSDALELRHIDPPDGRVGDDPIVASVWRASPTPDVAHFAIPAWDGLATTPTLSLLVWEPGTLQRGRGVFWLCQMIPKRHAWLQHFRF